MKIESMEAEGMSWTVHTDEAGETFWERQDMVANLGLQVDRRVLNRRGEDLVECPKTGCLLVASSTLRWWLGLGRSADKKAVMRRVLYTWTTLNAPAKLAPVELMPEPVPVEQVGPTTIDWRRFAYDDGDVRGISLRAMVEAGLYARMDHAVRALRAAGLPSSPVRGTHTHGQEVADYILTLLDAQRFAARARTEVGAAILDTILEHHAEFQRLLEGDQAAHDRLAAHRRPTPANDMPEWAGQIIAQLAALGATNKARVDEMAQGVEFLREDNVLMRQELEDTRLLHRMRPGEVDTTWMALRFDLFSSTGRVHINAVIALGLSWGLAEVGYMRQVEVEAGAGQDRATNPKWVFTADGWQRFGELLEQAHGGDDFQVVTLRRTYRVVRKKAVAS
jgi:hypothetical protein